MTSLNQKLSEMAYAYETPSHRNCYGCCQNDSDYEKAFIAGAKATLELPEVKEPYIALESIVASHDENIKQGGEGFLTYDQIRESRLALSTWKALKGEENG